MKGLMTWNDTILRENIILSHLPTPAPLTYSVRGPGVSSAKRLWNYLVRQEGIQELFVRWVLGRSSCRTWSQTLLFSISQFYHVVNCKFINTSTDTSLGANDPSSHRLLITVRVLMVVFLKNESHIIPRELLTHLRAPS